jgi:hypothetical protein
MVGYSNGKPPYRKPTATTVQSHKFGVGVLVVYKASATMERASFRITRHLPDGGQGLQYRIRCERDGHERVVTESNLERP